MEEVKHWNRKRRPRKPPQPPRWQNRMAEARTEADRLSAMCDRMRRAARQMQRPQSDATARRIDTERANQLLAAATEYLSGLAGSMERGDHDWKAGAA